MHKVHSAVHLVLQFQVLPLIPLFPFPIYSISDNKLTDALTYAFNMKVSELCIMVSFDILYILELQIRILIFHEWRYMLTTVLCMRDFRT